MTQFAWDAVKGAQALSSTKLITTFDFLGVRIGSLLRALSSLDELKSHATSCGGH
jgi:hypothetical protein